MLIPTVHMNGSAGEVLLAVGLSRRVKLAITRHWVRLYPCLEMGRPVNVGP